MPEDRTQTRKRKICVDCGTQNELQIAECVSCGGANFGILRQKEERSGIVDILSSVLALALSFYAFSIFQDGFNENWVIPLVALLFLISIGALIHHTYNYIYAKHIPGLQIIIAAIYVILVVAQFLR